MNADILIVDDDSAHRQMIRAVLDDQGYSVEEAGDGKEAVNWINRRFFNLVLMDVRMARMGGIEALKEIKVINPGITVIIMTAYASVSTAVEAIKAGAYDYITKPLDIDELTLLIGKALHYQKLIEENSSLKEILHKNLKFPSIIGRSSAIAKMLETIALVSPSDANVLITGESGTGKELIASALHQNSHRKDQPFITVNCAALPETLLESELFGHEKGAFTGALNRRQGRFQQAHNSSILLDEITEMSPTTQAKILRVIQEREFQPIGSTQTVRVDVRIIAATNRNLEQEIRAGRFREDLYYRLKVVTIESPPLRNRREDIPLLSNYFLSRYTEKNRKLVKGFSPRATDILIRHEWPGNVRELENVIERAVILVRGEVITPKELPEEIIPKDLKSSIAPSQPLAGRNLWEVEKEMILRTLEDAGWNRTHAAEILGISRRTLQLKLKEYGINPS